MKLKELLETVDTTSKYHDDRMKELDSISKIITQKTEKNSPEWKQWVDKYNEVRNKSKNKDLFHAEYKDLEPLLRLGQDIINKS